MKNGTTPEWAVTESESVRFTNYLVRDIDHLRPDAGSVAVTVDELNRLDESLSDTDYREPENESALLTHDRVVQRELILDRAVIDHLSLKGEPESPPTEE